MKLIGSLTEQREREELMASNAQLQSGDHPLAAPLQSRGVDLKKTYLLNWIPEQMEDLFVVLVGQSEVLRVEIDRQNDSIVTFERSPVKDYKPSGRPAHLRLAVALDLVKSAT